MDICSASVEAAGSKAYRVPWEIHVFILKLRRARTRQEETQTGADNGNLESFDGRRCG